MIPVDFEDRRICIIGLGYVGLTLAVALADVGFHVVGIESNPSIRECLADKRAHFSETGIDKRLRAVIEAGRLEVHGVIPPHDSSTAYVITVGTPVDETKQTKLAAIQNVASMVAGVLKPDDLIILRSTVRVGVSRTVVKPILDQANVPYQIAFCPERTIEGKAIEELRSLPQVVGGIDTASTLRASRLFHMLTPSVVRVSSLEAAEMVKLVNNTYRDISFAFANEVAFAAEAAGLSATEVIRAGNLGYPRGGLPLPGPVGGPCLEKDPYILAEGLALHGFSPELSLAGRRLNETLPQRVSEFLDDLSRRRDLSVRRIAVVGVAFKGRPATSDLRGTLALPLIENLRASFPKAEIVAWDPVADAESVRLELGVEAFDHLGQAVDGAALVVIQNNHPAFRELDFAEVTEAMAANGVIYDLWGQNEGEDLSLENGVAYGTFGSAILKERPAKTIETVAIPANAKLAGVA